MICPVCQPELGVERREDELVLTYSFKEWVAGCRSRAEGDPAPFLRPTILKLLPETKASEPRAKDE
jgi:hypothetical protein